MLPEVVDGDGDVREDGEQRKSCSLEVDGGNEVEDRIEDLSRGGEDVGRSRRSSRSHGGIRRAHLVDGGE